LSQCLKKSNKPTAGAAVIIPQWLGPRCKRFRAFAAYGAPDARLDRASAPPIMHRMLADLLRYRGFILRHAKADLRHRYAGTGMGLAWNVIHPLAIIAIYSIVFQSIFKLPATPGRGRWPYTLYLCSGFFPWLAFSDCVSRGCNSFIANATYLKKLPIPEQVFVAQNAVAGTISLGINFALLLIVAIALGWSPAWTWLLLPIPLISLQAMAFGIGLLLGSLNVFFRDIAEWLAIALQLLMWTVPIVYRLDTIPPWLNLHPLLPPLRTIRCLFLVHQLPPAGDWIALAIWPALFVMLALTTLRQLRPEIRDAI
jgi:ABC-type polysaccharide/polyol phosphate export permease